MKISIKVFLVLVLAGALYTILVTDGSLTLGIEQQTRQPLEPITTTKNLTESIDEVPNLTHIDGAIKASKKTASQLTNTNEESESERMHTEKEIAQLAAKKFIESNAFSNEAALNNAYLWEDGSVSQNSLQHTFIYEDFGNVIDRLEHISENDESLERTSALSTKLYNELGQSIFNEKYSCRGKVCALGFAVSDEIKEDTLSKLSEFAKNYTFTSHKKNEHGESIYRILYISTDDPSLLSVR